MSGSIKSLILWVIIGIILFSVFNNFQPHGNGNVSLGYSDFLHQVAQGDVKSVVVDTHVHGVLQNNKTFDVYIPIDKISLNDLTKKNVNITAMPLQQELNAETVLINWLPTILLIVIWIYFLRKMRGNRNKSTRGDVS